MLEDKAIEINISESIKRAEHSQPTQSTTPAAAMQLPPELQLPVPRSIKYYPASNRPNPLTLQKLMLINPITWGFIYFGYMCLGPDTTLVNSGVEHTAVLDHIYEPHRGALSELNYLWVVNGQSYIGKVPSNQPKIKFNGASQITVRCLPSDPSYFEPIGSEPGTRRWQDAAWALLLGVLFVSCEVAIFKFERKHRRIAACGIPAFGRVNSIHTESKGRKIATVSYQTPGRHHVVDYSGHINLQVDQTKLLLCDPDNLNSFVFYDQCMFHPTLSQTKNL
jgi:hypothetical protein